jgi:hypothetical protein
VRVTALSEPADLSVAVFGDTGSAGAGESALRVALLALTPPIGVLDDFCGASLATTRAAAGDLSETVFSTTFGLSATSAGFSAPFGFGLSASAGFSAAFVVFGLSASAALSFVFGLSAASFVFGLSTALSGAGSPLGQIQTVALVSAL